MFILYKKFLLSEAGSICPWEFWNCWKVVKIEIRLVSINGKSLPLTTLVSLLKPKIRFWYSYTAGLASIIPFWTPNPSILRINSIFRNQANCKFHFSNAVQEGWCVSQSDLDVSADLGCFYCFYLRGEQPVGSGHLGLCGTHLWDISCDVMWSSSKVRHFLWHIFLLISQLIYIVISCDLALSDTYCDLRTCDTSWDFYVWWVSGLTMPWNITSW